MRLHNQNCLEDLNELNDGRQSRFINGSFKNNQIMGVE